MPLAGIVTLVGVALTVAALAYYLIHVIVLLGRTHFNLGTIVAGLRAIAHQAAPLERIVGEMNQDLHEVQSLMGRLVQVKVLEGAEEAREVGAAASAPGAASAAGEWGVQQWPT